MKEIIKHSLDLTDRYTLLSTLPKTYAVGLEIGVWQGWFTMHMISRTNMHIIGVDPWISTESYEDSDQDAPNFNPFEIGVDGYKWQEARYQATINLLKQNAPPQRWTIYRSYSNNLCNFIDDKTLDFVYVDGEHTYDAVSNDIEVWWPKIKENGILAGHDYNDTNPGTIRAVDEFATKIGAEPLITGTSPEKGDANAPSWLFIK